MKIYLKTISNQTYEYNVEPSTSIAELKERVSIHLGVSLSGIKMYFKSKVLQDETTIEQTEVNESGFIILFVGGSSKQNVSLPKEKSHAKENFSPKEMDLEPKKEKSSERILNVAPLPSLVPNNRMKDPPNFEEMVSLITSMGFQEGEVCEALRAAHYNSDQAVDYLISGYIPAPSLIFDSSNEEKAFNYEEEDQEEMYQYNMYRQIHQILDNDPSSLEKLIHELQESDPELVRMFKKDPNGFISSFGLDPARFDLNRYLPKTQFEMLLSKFSVEQRSAIKRIEKLGFDSMIVLQVFEACNKDEELTKACLKAMC